MRYIFKKGKKKEELMRMITESHIERVQAQIECLERHGCDGKQLTLKDVLTAQEVVLKGLLNDFDRL